MVIKMNKRMISAFLSVIILLCMVSCSKSNDSGDLYQLKQFDNIKTADIIIKDYGTISLYLFEEEAPKAVENFTALANEGYYDGLTFHSVIKDFCIQGGDINGDGTGTVSSFGGGFDNEISSLIPCYGALCMANFGVDASNYSQFFIVGTDKEDISEIETLLEYKDVSLLKYIQTAYHCDINSEELDAYREYGGAPWLYGKNTVFGQVYSGFDVLEKIMTVEVLDTLTYKPLEDIIIERVIIND